MLNLCKNCQSLLIVDYQASYQTYTPVRQATRPKEPFRRLSSTLRANSQTLGKVLQAYEDSRDISSFRSFGFFEKLPSCTVSHTFAVLDAFIQDNVGWLLAGSSQALDPSVFALNQGQ